MILPIQPIHRLIPPIHNILSATFQPRRKDRCGIVQQVPLARVTPVARTVQRRSAAGPDRAEDHVYHPGGLVLAAGDRREERCFTSTLLAGSWKPGPHRIPMLSVLGPISLPLAREFPNFFQTPRFGILILRQNEIAQRPHRFSGSVYGRFLFGAAVAEV